MKPAIDAQSSRSAPAAEGDSRAIFLLKTLRQQQRGLARSSALAWERAVFCEAFLDPEPARRVRAFLSGESR
jgi:hypothetical protein